MVGVGGGRRLRKWNLVKGNMSWAKRVKKNLRL